MSVIVRYVEDDLTTVLLDLNNVGDSWTGAGFAVMNDPDFGPSNRAIVTLSQQGVDGVILATAWDTTTVMTLPIAVRATTKQSTDEIVALWRALAFRVAAGGFIEVQLPGESESRFYEALPSGVPNLIAGQKDVGLHVAGGGFETNAGPLAIMLQPSARLAKRIADTQLLTNASMLRDSNLDGRPDGITYSATTGITAESISDAEEAYAVTRNSATSIDLRFPTAATTVGQTRAGSVYAAANVSGIARIQPVLQWMNGGALVSEDVGTLTPLGPVADPSDRPRLTVAGTAPATTTNVRFVLRMNNASASAVISYLAQAQVESGLVATAWRLGTETIGTAIPTSTVLLHNPGNVPALLKLSVDPVQSNANVVQVRAHLRSQNRPKGKVSAVLEWLNKFAPGFELESTTLSTGTASVAVGAASGGNVAQTTFTAPAADDQGVLVQCWSKSLSPTDVAALEGAFYACVVLSTTAAAKFRPQLRYAGQATLGSVVAPYSLDPIIYNTTNIAAGDLSQYSLVNLGVVRVDPGRGDNGLTLQGWASLETAGSAAKLNWDALFLLPCDELSALYTEPSFLPGGSATDEWAGYQLVTPTDPAGKSAGTVFGQQIVLNAANEAAGTPPVAGFHPTAGRHTVTVKGQDRLVLRCDDKVARAVSELVVRIVGAPGTTIKTQNLWSKAGLKWSVASRGDTIVFDVPGDAATTDFVEYYVNELTATAGCQTNVRKITHSVVKGASGGSNAPVVIDAIERTAYVTGANPIAAPQGFIYVPPGYSALTLIALDRNNMGFDAVYTGPFGPETMGAYIAARTYTVEPDSVPRVKPL